MPTKIKIGTILVDGGSLYTVHKIKLEIIREKPEKVIYYKPLYKSVSNNTLECSIPESNLEMSNLKELRTLSEIREFLDYLSDSKIRKINIDIENIMTVSGFNDIYKTGYVIKHFWKEYNTDGSALTKTKYNLLNKSIDMVTEEVSHVMGISLEKGKELILKELNKFSKSKNLTTTLRTNRTLG